MRVLMISDVYFPRVNGVSTSIRSFRRELQAQGHQVTLVTPAYPHSAEFDQQHPDPDLIRVTSLPIPRDPEDRLMRRSQLLQLLPELKKQSFDVVHIQTPFVAHYAGVTLARQLKLPTIESYHTFFEEYLYHYVPLIPRGVLRFAARRFTVSQCNSVKLVIAPSHAMHDALRNYGVTTPITILPTGLEASQFKRGNSALFRQQHGFTAQQPIALYVGRVAHEKNIDFLLTMFKQTLAQVPQATLLIVGEGPAVPHLRGQVQQLGIHHAVKFIGYLDRDSDLLDCYSAGDVFVFASRTETQGLVLLESLAQGTPVVSTAHMGTRDILEAAQGAQIVNEDTAQFAQVVANILSNPPVRVRLAAHAVVDAQRWSSVEMTQRLLRLYTELVATK
ncbi:MAG: glycosyltransferase [Steroidobacteraceae bacterium]